MPVLIPQPLQQRNLKEAQGNDGAVTQINRKLKPLISAEQSVLARDFQNQLPGEFVFLGDYLEGSSGWVDSPQDISNVLSCWEVGGVDVSSRVPSGKGGIEGC